MSWQALLYNLVSLLALPGITVAVWWRYVRHKHSRPGLHERIGYLPAPIRALADTRQVVWIHAVSVGETMAAKPLIAALKQARPDLAVVLSQGTETGREVARQAGADGLFYLPLDLVWVVTRALRRVRPALLCTVDTELWPNLFWRARRRGAMVAVVNGRIGEKTLRAGQWWLVGWAYRWCLSNAHRLLMQSQQDVERVRLIGGEQAEFAGNLKGDEAFPEVGADRLEYWRTTLGLASDQPVLVAGSTGPGEEDILLRAYAQVCRTHPLARLVLVPRQVNRADEIAGLVSTAGLQSVRRSQLPDQAARSLSENCVIIVDTIGELAELYAVGAVCFVGRSLVDMGGSNVLQAAAQGKPVLSGPFVSNMRDSVALLAGAQALVTVHDAGGIAKQTLLWLDDPDEAAATGERGRQAVLANRGATERTVAALLELLDGPTT